MRRPSLLLVSVLFASSLSGCVSPEHPVTGSVFEDENLETLVISQINSRHIANTHVNVTCLNRRVLLTGEVPSEAAKSDIEKTVSGVAKVRAINNELVVGGIIGLSSRTADSWIASDVKFSFIHNGSLHASDIKITVENGTVFLMGTVHRKDGAAAAELASTTKRVQRVILLFEYLD